MEKQHQNSPLGNKKKKKKHSRPQPLSFQYSRHAFVGIHLTRYESKHQHDGSGRNEEFYRSYCVQDKDAGFALRGDEQAKQSLVALAVMIQVHVANTP